MDTLYRDIQRTKLYENPRAVGNAKTSLYTYEGLKKVISLTRNALYWKQEIEKIPQIITIADFAQFPLKTFALKTDYLLRNYIQERISHQSHFEISRDIFCMTISILIAVFQCLRSALPFMRFSVLIDGDKYNMDCSKVSLSTQSIHFAVGFDKRDEKYTDYYPQSIRSNIREALNTCKKMGIPITCTAKGGYYVFTVTPVVAMKKYLDALKEEIYIKEHPEEFEDFDFNDPLAGLDNWLERNRRG